MHYTGSINDPKYRSSRGYLCGAFPNPPIFSKKLEVAYMSFDELKKHIGGKHHHDIMDEFILILDGYMEQEVNGELLKLGKGDFVYIEAKSISGTKRIDKGTTILVVKSPSVPEDKIID